MRNLKTRVPKFKNEDQEREFWATHSPLDYFDSSKPLKGLFPNLKPSLRSVSIRLPEDLLFELKNLANKRDVPYQSLLKVFLAEQIALERGLLTGTSGRRRRKKSS
ncbi:MAG: BrnA antitoxin family protein [Chloroflexi bacterium]|nr:BrnA antitoxin family protein [Chloroflexota bacterium]